MYGIQYNGLKDTDIGVLVVSRPSVPAPGRKLQHGTLRAVMAAYTVAMILRRYTDFL